MTSLPGGITNQTPEDLLIENLSTDEQEQSVYNLSDVSSTSEKYLLIEEDFKNAGLEITRIESLNNLHLTKRFITERDQMYLLRVSKDPNFKLNEKYLYHGTTAPKDYICEEGLDSRVSKEGCFGRGIYFSDYPRKCAKYAEKETGPDSIILLTRVVLGDAKVYSKGVKDRNLKREPEKPQPCTGFRFYDSVEGCPVNHKEFVVYENRRALVECIISYQRLLDLQDSNSPQANSNNSGVDNNSAQFEDSDTSSDDEAETEHNDKSDDSDTSDTDDGEDIASDTVDDVVDTGEEILQRLEKQFTDLTGVKEKHLIDVYLLMGNQDVNQAVKIYKDAEKNNDTGLSQEDFIAKMVDDLSSKPNNSALYVDAEKWKEMSAADREAATKCLVESFIDVIGAEQDSEDAKTMARKYLKSVDMNLDLAIASYFEELSAM